MIGDYTVDQIRSEYSNPDSPIWAKGGVGGAWINPHVEYTGEHDLEGDKFWQRGEAASRMYVDETEGLY